MKILKKILKWISENENKAFIALMVFILVFGYGLKWILGVDSVTSEDLNNILIALGAGFTLFKGSKEIQKHRKKK